jgi:hypothetical protein
LFVGDDMGGKKQSLSRKDIETLKCFFDKTRFHKNEDQYYKLIEKWKKISDIQLITSEYPYRLEPRLERLAKFGLLRQNLKPKNSEHPEWYITYTSLYYILAKMKNNLEIRKFIQTNSQIGHLDRILDNAHMEQINIFLAEINQCARKYQYHKIINVIKEFFNEIEPRYIDWNLELEPDARTKI